MQNIDVNVKTTQLFFVKKVSNTFSGFFITRIRSQLKKMFYSRKDFKDALKML